MKKDLTIIKNETRFIAINCLDGCKRTERYLLPLFHELLLCPESGAKYMVADIATILMDENYSHTYLKYAN